MYDPFASTPDYIAPEIAFPLMAVFWAIWFVLGSEQRRNRRAARKAEQYNDSL
ncbi:membrane protein [Arthrobacter phage Argan]|nr:membrane protein [Arthrobacter phage Zeina]WNT45422.1 membrane protein [Arthrobacter phage Argan]